MASTEVLRRRIRSTQDLGSVVRTMKALAAASVRQYEEAVAALEQYDRNVTMALQGAARHIPEEILALDVVYDNDRDAGDCDLGTAGSETRLTADPGPGTTGSRRGSCYGALVIGTDQGMCGSFNDQIASFAAQRMLPGTRIWAIGERLVGALWTAGLEPEVVFAAPGALEGITAAVTDLLERFDDWRRRERVERLTIYHNRPTGAGGIEPQALPFWPVDLSLLDRMRRMPWDGPSLPLVLMPWRDLVAAVVRQYLFIGVYRSLGQSLAAENASRLATMERAEQNIDERLTELEAEFNYLRQESITAELLDIVSGFEALTK